MARQEKRSPLLLGGRNARNSSESRRTHVPTVKPKRDKSLSLDLAICIEWKKKVMTGPTAITIDTQCGIHKTFVRDEVLGRKLSSAQTWGDSLNAPIGRGRVSESLALELGGDIPA